jgi:hypothetical protein
MLNGSFGRGLASLASNPYILTAMATVATALASILSMAIAGALTLAFGGAAIGLGAFLLKDEPKVRKVWGKTISDLKVKFSEAAKPLIPALEEAARMVGRLGDKFAPHFRKAMEDTEPIFTQFIGRLEGGIAKFGKRAWKPLMDGFNVLLEALPIESILNDWGRAFGRIGKLVRDHSEEIAFSLQVVSRMLTFVLDAIVGISEGGIAAFRGVTVAIGWVVKAVGYLTRGFMEAVGLILTGAAKAFGWIPGIGGKLERSARNFKQWGRTASKKLDDVGNNIKDLGKKMDRANSRNKLKVNISQWQRQLERAKAKLRTVPRSKQAKVRAEISQLQRKIRQAKAAVASLHGKTVTVRTNYVSTLSKNHFYKVPLMRASGGFVGAAAGGGPRSNRVMVGEQGPEIVDLPPGSRVRSNPDTRRIMGQGRGGGGLIHLTVNLGNERLGDLMIDPLRKTIKRRGGNVQAVLGQ